MDDPLKTVRTDRRAVLGAAAAAALIRGRGVKAGETRTVRFAFFGTASEQAAYRRLIDAFHAVRPEITVEAVGMNSGDASLVLGRNGGTPYQPYVESALTSAQPPDVVLLSYQRFRTMADQGLLEPLGKYAAASPTLNLDDFYPTALDAFRSPDLPGDGLGGLPQNASSLAVYYNQDIFAKFGVLEPADDWSWSDFASTAAALTIDLDGDGLISIHGLAVEPKISRWAAFVWGAGGELADDPDRPTKLTFDTKEAQDGLRFFASLGPGSLNVTPSETEARLASDLYRFTIGRAAMVIHTRRIVPTLRQTQGLRWDVAPIPVGKFAANVLHSDAFCMARGAHDKEAAWAFLEFAAGPEGQTVLAESGRTVPSLRSVAESAAFLKGTSLAASFGMTDSGLALSRAHVFLDNVAISRALPPITGLPVVEASFDHAFKRAFYVDGDVAAAAANMIGAIRGVRGDRLSAPRYVALAGEAEAEE